VVTATAPVTVASMTVQASGELDLDGTNIPVSFTVANGGKLINNGTVKVVDATNNVSVEGASGGWMTFEGTDINKNAKALSLARLTYKPVLDINPAVGTGDAVSLTGSATFYGIFIHVAGGVTNP